MQAAAEGAAAHCLAEIQAQLQVLRATRQELSVAAAAAQDDTPVAEPGAENHVSVGASVDASAGVDEDVGGSCKRGCRCELTCERICS